MPNSAVQKYVYADLTWPEVNEAVEMEKVILLPVGSTEQHGPHLPLDVDNVLPTSVCIEAGRRAPDKILVAPTIPYGFNIHAMDFPGTIHVSWDHFIDYCADVCKSFAYHGFKRIVIVDGHGSNEHLLEFVGRRVILETDALIASFMWLNLLRKDPEFLPSVRESAFPGGMAHACELETAMYLHIAGEKVQMDKAEDHITRQNDQGTTGFQYVDLFGGGPVAIVEWTSTYTPNGVAGQPTLATAEKGRAFFEEAATRLVEFIGEFQKRPNYPRVDHHMRKPTSPLPKP
jgi:creatinine amidohydrolase